LIVVERYREEISQDVVNSKARTIVSETCSSTLSTGRFVNMIDETKVPLRSRFLWLEGRLNTGKEGRSPHSEAALRRALPLEWPTTSRICVVGYAYATLPLPKEFDTMFAADCDECVYDYDGDDCTAFRPHHLASAVAVTSRILAVTQQFLTPECEIPNGWKTICLIDFPSGVPDMVEQLPEVDGWGISSHWVCLCDSATWSELVSTAPC
jgi:hypothetical protein